MKNTCIKSGKIMYDKKGAMTLKNTSMKRHHIKMSIYNCPFCNKWHLATIGNHRGKLRENRRGYRLSD